MSNLKASNTPHPPHINQSPGRLTQMSVNTLMDALGRGTTIMDSVISGSQKAQGRGQSQGLGPAVSTSSFDEYQAGLRAAGQTATQVIRVREYLNGVMGEKNGQLAPILLQNGINRSVTSRNIPLLRLILRNDTTGLDFRALDPSCPTVLGGQGQLNQRSGEERSLSSSPCSPISTTPFSPPNEFDWFSGDRLGRILLMSEACEIFSIIKMSQCPPVLETLLLNARRPEYWTIPKPQMPIFASTLTQLRALRTCVLRGFADDHMLKLLGGTCTGLVTLDVSFSHFVTSRGVLNLLIPDLSEDKIAMVLMANWINSNLDGMNPCSRTLETLDLSWTSVDSIGRKMLNLLPGTFMFKRIFAQNENEAYGHHIFLRSKPQFTGKIPMFTGPNLLTGVGGSNKAHDLEKSLQTILGRTKALTHFQKFYDKHSWSNSSVHLYALPVNKNKARAPAAGPSGGHTALITHSREERRIQGLVTFGSGTLTELYTIYPVNLNHLGGACPQLRSLCAHVTDAWKAAHAFIPTLTQVDLFAEPGTLISFLSSCPNLVRVRARVLKRPLKEDQFLQAIKVSMCSRTIHDLWLAPGSFKVGNSLQGPSSLASFNDPGPDDRASMSGVKGATSGTMDFHALTGHETGADSSKRLDDLIHLSNYCVHELLRACPRLQRIGNLSWWWITEEEVEDLCHDLLTSKSGTKLLWDNLVLPSDGNNYEDGRIKWGSS